MGPDPAILDWSRSIRAIWARRLVGVAKRDETNPALPERWAEAIATAWSSGWELRGAVPLTNDPRHRWAIVLRRRIPGDPPTLVFVHGTTATAALDRCIEAIRGGVEIPA